jgi:hypothetical protein
MSNISFSEFLPFSPKNLSTEKFSLEDEIYLSDNGNVVFHWADFYETCELIKNSVYARPEVKADFSLKEKSLNKLKLISVWIKSLKKVHQTTMYDLYEQAVQSRFNFSNSLGLNGDAQVSFISSTGPFKKMAITDCFNKETYKDFVLISLLRDKLPRRDYRLRLKSKVLFQYGLDFSKSSLMGLEQLTMNGMLFSVDCEEYSNFISKQTDLKVLIDSSTLKSSLGKNLTELNQFLSQFAFNLFYSSRYEDSILCQLKDFSVQTSFDFYQNKKIYLFISYDKLSGQPGFDVGIIKDFVAHTKELIRQTYKLDQDLKLA